MKEIAKKEAIGFNTTSEMETTEKRNSNRKTYSYEEAVKGATEYFKNDELAANVWINKYALKDSAGNIYENSPNQMHEKISI